MYDNRCGSEAQVFNVFSGEKLATDRPSLYFGSRARVSNFVVPHGAQDTASRPSECGQRYASLPVRVVPTVVFLHTAVIANKHATRDTCLAHSMPCRPVRGTSPQRRYFPAPSRFQLRPLRSISTGIVAWPMVGIKRSSFCEPVVRLCCLSNSTSVWYSCRTSMIPARPETLLYFRKVYPCRSYCVQLAKTCANNVVEWQELCRSIRCPPTDEECMPGPFDSQARLSIGSTTTVDPDFFMAVTGRGGEERASLFTRA